MVRNRFEFLRRVRPGVEEYNVQLRRDRTGCWVDITSRSEHSTVRYQNKVSNEAEMWKLARLLTIGGDFEVA